VRVLISGAGIAGLALAQRLGTHGVEVTVVEQAAGPRTGGYMMDFFGPGYDAAEAMGLLPRILELGYHVDELVYCDDGGRARSRLRFAQVAEAAGTRLVSIMRPDLERALREHLPPGVEVRYARTVTAVADRGDGVTVTLDDGSSVTADLLVGCDGIHSGVRALVHGAEREHVRRLGLHTAAFTFEDADVWREVDGRFCVTDTRQRAMGFYGLRDGRVAAFAVHRTAEPTVPADPRAALRAEYGSLGWVVPRALQACPAREHVYYDEVAQVVAASWTRGRVTMLGDAAYAVSLLAGQGASLAIAGAYVLAERLTRSASVETAVAEYEHTMRPLVLDRQRRARNGTRWLVPRTRCEQGVRRAAIAVAGSPLGARLVAARLTGTSPSL
jgi:2-polyprenyl-6-methoxyphenol hydroxylase-like FAD-dependent oxidoreductase